MFPNMGAAGAGEVDMPGGGDNSGNMEARIANLEADVRDLRKDIRQLLYIAIGSAVAILGVLCTGYVRLDDKMEAKFDKVNGRIEALSVRVDTHFQQLDAKFEAKLNKIIESLSPPPKP